MLIHLENVTFGYTGDPNVDGASFSVNEEERIGLIGSNGAGKTTLIRLMLGDLNPDSGSVTKKNAVRIGYLEQNGGFESESTVYAAMEELFGYDRELIAELGKTEVMLAQAEGNELSRLSARLDSLHRRIAARDSYHYDVRIKTVLNGMGFGAFYERKVSTMSGGEKTKLKLCRLLLEEPELLVLDEPTNHLDLKTLFWLEEYLSSYKGAIFIVSHDRYFLDKLTSRTLELERGKVFSYKGNYTKYKRLKEERLKERRREYERTLEEIAKLEDYVNRNIVRATTAKSAQSRVKQLSKIDLPEKPLPPPEPPRFRFSYSEKPYEKVLSVDKFDLTAGEKTLLSGAEFTLMRGEKCALVGDNGTGKSTLLKYLLSGKPEIKYGKFVKIAYYDQENADLDGEERVLDAFWGKHALLSRTDARKLLAQAGISAEDVDKKVKELSGGLKAKLELSLLEAKQGNVLFLDEPTNHLDLPAREALEEALVQFDGTVLFVSHDRRFIEAIANRIVTLENGRLSSFRGGYRAFLEQEKAPLSAPDTESRKPKTDCYRSKEERAKEARRRTRAKEIETELEALEREEAELGNRLIECAADYVKVREISQRQDEILRQTELLYAEYETLI